MIDIADVEAAAKRIQEHVRRTPLVHSASLSEQLGTQVHLKLELLQKTGSFKPRGAFNQMLQLDAAARQRGVVAVSGGNFAQGAAYAGRVLGIPCVICMPQYTPANYVEATRAYGAEVELHADMPACFARVRALQDEGRTALHAWDKPEQMAGNGVIGLELLEQLPQISDLIVSVGGGGLLAGLIVALKARAPQVRIWAVETEDAPTLGAALRAGTVVQIVPSSLAKTLGAPYLAADALTLAQQHLQDYVAVSDQEAIADQRWLLERCKLLTELAAACTLSAARRLRGRFGADDRVVLLLCGGNESLANLMHYAKLPTAAPTPGQIGTA
ncbi:threonine ammonia-lyase [Paucibacter soli]|uniref:threonine ammonia-lyase n=1 Tax=Paucibacter soli TaxID=3133433 RepID=UPI00309A72A9